MKIIRWNCRGLGSPHTIPSLKYLVRVYKSNILFLWETISIPNKTEELKYVLGYDCCFLLSANGVVVVLLYIGSQMLVVLFLIIPTIT